jgi:uncharacterized damage-inducible protein DinB
VKLATFAAVLATCGVAYAQSSNPLTAGATFQYGIIKDYVTRAALKIPEAEYAFRPTPEVRSVGQLIAHLADSNYRLCSVIAGQDPPIDAGIERNTRTKADLAKALGESFAYCDKQYASMTDNNGTPLVKFDAGGEGARVPVQMPRLSLLAFHTAHAFEHYGNLATYMRVRGIVPPSSEPPFGVYKPPQ